MPPRSRFPRIARLSAPGCLLAAAVGFAAAAQSDPQAARDRLRSAIEARIQRDGALAAVAFATLDGRDDLELNADTPFHAASTMKVAVLIDLYRQVDEGRLTMDTALPVRNRFSSIVDGSPYQLDPADDSDTSAYRAIGGTMPVRELAESMIAVSSNLATNLLIEKLGVARIQESVTALRADGMKVLRGVEDGKAFEQGLVNTTTARALRVLLSAIANGTAASDAACGEMIAMLRRQQFNDGIPAGLPPGTPVAHKTGTITAIHHDAAIVYAKRPYVLVVLVRGIEDQKASAALIADITRMVHAHVTP